MAVSMTVADNADGTGSVATISGSLGAANDVYYTLFGGGSQTPSYSWTLGGSRVGDGTVPLALGVGYYQYLLVSGSFSTANSVLVYGQVTDATITEAHIQLLDGAIARINALAMLSSDYVMKKWLPRASDPEITLMKNTGTSLIFCCPTGQEEYVGMVTSEDDIVLPVQVSIAYAANHDSVANLNQMLSRRNRIARALRYQRLAGMSGEAAKQLTCHPKPGPIVDPDAYVSQNLLVSHYFFGYQVRQTRGLS